MIHLKYKCKVNFVKLHLIWIYWCLKLVFENATAGRNTGCRSVVNRACGFSPLFLMTSAASIVSTWHTSCYTRFTRGRVRELKNAHNSVTVQNRTHVYMNFFDHKDLGNHLLQLCPKVVKHPVYIWHSILWSSLTYTNELPGLLDTLSIPTGVIPNERNRKILIQIKTWCLYFTRWCLVSVYSNPKRNC